MESVYQQILDPRYRITNKIFARDSPSDSDLTVSFANHSLQAIYQLHGQSSDLV